MDVSPKKAYRWPVGTEKMLNIAKYEKCKSKLQWGTTSRWSDWSSLKKSLQITNAGEDVEKREPTYTVDENVSCCSHYGK